MSNDQKLYIAGIGMITPIGANTLMTAASVRAGISGYKASDFFNQENEPYTMAELPPLVYSSLPVEIDEGAYYSELYDRVIKMAIIAASEALSQQTIEKPVPLILGMAENIASIKNIPLETLTTNLVNQARLPIDPAQIRSIHTGRASGIEALDLAHRYLYELQQDFVLIGASDSYWNFSIIKHLEQTQRLLAPGVQNGFAGGEGSGFLLLTRHPQKAINNNNSIVGLSLPGLSEEPGHFYSDKPYRGDGLSEAFRQAFRDYSGDPIKAVYGSMNGENYWVKEYGVAMTRNHSFFDEKVEHEHPADCYGDMGAATGPILMGLAAQGLLKQARGLATYLVYSSSDGSWRAAVRLEKIAFNMK